MYQIKCSSKDAKFTFKSCAISNILDNLVWSHSPRIYQSAIHCINSCLIVIFYKTNQCNCQTAFKVVIIKATNKPKNQTWLCHIWCKITVELAWLAKKTGMSVDNTSCLNKVIGWLVCSTANDKKSGQCWIGCLSSSCTWVMSPRSARCISKSTKLRDRL